MCRVKQKQILLLHLTVTYKDTGPANKSKQNKALQISVTYFEEITSTEAVLHFKVR